MAPNGRRCSELMGKRWRLIEPIPLGAGNGGVAKKFQRSDQVNALSRLTDFQSIAPWPESEKPPVVRISTKLMVCELLMGVVAHARFQRHNAAHLVIRHGGVTLQTL